MEFKNMNPAKTYKCFLYKKVDGKVISKLFVGEEATQAGADDGWQISPAAFVDEALADFTEGEKETVKQAADSMAQDVTVIANADTIEDEKFLRETYEALAGRKMHGRIRSLAGVRQACKDLLGDLNAVNK